MSPLFTLILGIARLLGKALREMTSQSLKKSVMLNEKQGVLYSRGLTYESIFRVRGFTGHPQNST